MKVNISQSTTPVAAREAQVLEQCGNCIRSVGVDAGSREQPGRFVLD